MISKFYWIFALVLVLVGFQTGSAQYVDRVVEAEPESVTVLHNNGNFTTGNRTESGVAAPTGFVWSENQHDTANMTESTSVLGYGATFGAVRLADNFTVPAGQTWRISSIEVWGFVEGWTSSQSPFTGGVLQIWNGKPGNPGSTVIFGDLVTDRLLSTTPGNVYIISNTVVGPGLPQDFTRRLFENKFSIAPTLTLGPGTYWIDFATSTFGNGAQFYRQVITPGARALPTWNARQFIHSSNTWQDVIDGGRPTTAADVPQDIAFHVNGTIASSNNASKFADYDGDGKTDFAITRWGPAPSSPSEWFILRNNGSGNFNYAQFGARAGSNRLFNGVFQLDTVLPDDYDGDGKADIAVYAGARGTTAQPEAYFYIINSSNNTLRSEQFGTRTDYGTLMGDYDGDGKADLALYRDGATTGAQSFFFVKKSSNGEIVSVPWGVRGDFPVLGDYDGDGKQDFSVARIVQVTGEATLYTLRSSDRNYTVTPLPYPFIAIVPGDYDGDGKTDIATIKNSLNNMVWTITRSSDDVTETLNYGIYSTDVPTQGDYNGDGKTDIAVYRKTGQFSTNPSFFFIRQPDGSSLTVPWGDGRDNALNSVRAYGAF